MKKEIRRDLFAAVCMLVAFALWTIALCRIDVQAIGPQGSAVGFASINKAAHDITGVHMTLYLLTDWLSLIPVCFAIGFASLVLIQWRKRKQLRLVDRSLLILGGFYLVVLAAYGLFEYTVINYRPILINGILEASYPSSTTMLAICVMSTASIQLKDRIKTSVLYRCISWAILALTAFLVIGRLISGVHWFTDIIGGIFLSTGLVLLYRSVSRLSAKPSQSASDSRN